MFFCLQSRFLCLPLIRYLCMPLELKCLCPLLLLLLLLLMVLVLVMLLLQHVELLLAEKLGARVYRELAGVLHVRGRGSGWIDGRPEGMCRVDHFCEVMRSWVWCWWLGGKDNKLG